MGIESEKKSNNNGGLIFPEYDLFVNIKKKDNEEYKKGGLVFPSYELYKVLKMINKRLSLLYTETGEEYDYEPILDSPARHNGYFDDICKNINYHISFFKDIYENDSRVGEFLHENRLSDKFYSLFGAIYIAFMEAMTGGDNKIKKIVRELAYYGVDPFSPHKV